jgi:hypothetical protein
LEGPEVPVYGYGKLALTAVRGLNVSGRALREYLSIFSCILAVVVRLNKFDRLLQRRGMRYERGNKPVAVARKNKGGG